MWIWLPIFLTWCNLATAAAGFLIPPMENSFCSSRLCFFDWPVEDDGNSFPSCSFASYGGYAGYGTLGTLGTVREVRWVRYDGTVGTVRWYGGCVPAPTVPYPSYPHVPYPPYPPYRTVPSVPSVPYPPYPPYQETAPAYQDSVPTYRKCHMYLPVLNHQKTCTFLCNAANCEAVGSSASSGGAPIVTMKFWYHLSTSDASGGNNSDSSCWSMGTHFEYPLFDSTWNPCRRFLSNYVSWGTFRLAPWVHVLELCLADPWLEGYHPCDHNRDEQGKKNSWMIYTAMPNLLLACRSQNHRSYC